MDKFKGLYRFMPVPNGMGPSTLDYLLCYRGRFIAIEAKKPGGKMTDRQKHIAERIRVAGGRVFLVDDDTSTLEDYLEELKKHDPE